MRPDDFAEYRIFKVVRRMGNTFADLLQKRCSTQGMSYAITPSQWAVLAWLDEENGVPIGTLAQHLEIEASVTTGIVQRMEQHGLLERVHDHKDRRLVKIFLTDDGRQLVHALNPIVSAFHEMLFQGLPPDAQQSFFAHFQHLDNNLSNISHKVTSPRERKGKETNET